MNDHLISSYEFRRDFNYVFKCSNALENNSSETFSVENILRRESIGSQIAFETQAPNDPFLKWDVRPKEKTVHNLHIKGGSYY